MIRANSAEGIVTRASYSVSGMLSWSASISISFISYSAIWSESVGLVKVSPRGIETRRARSDRHTFGFVRQVEDIRLIRSFDHDDIVVLGTSQDFGETCDVDAERPGVVAVESLEHASWSRG